MLEPANPRLSSHCTTKLQVSVAETQATEPTPEGPNIIRPKENRDVMVGEDGMDLDGGDESKSRESESGSTRFRNTRAIDRVTGHMLLNSGEKS